LNRASCSKVLTWAAYQALTIPEHGNHVPKHVGVDLELIKKINYFLEHLLVLLQMIKRLFILQKLCYIINMIMKATTPEDRIPLIRLSDK
jgi:hypothetical protein